MYKSIIVILSTLSILMALLCSCGQTPPDSNQQPQENAADSLSETETDSLSAIPRYDSAEIPVLTYNEENALILAYDGSIPTMIFSENKVGDYTVYLLGDNVMKIEGRSDTDIFCFNLRVAISKDEKTFAEEYPVSSAVTGVSQGAFTLNGDAIDGYMSTFELSCPLIVVKYSTENVTSGLFYAIKNDSLYMLMGDLSAVGGTSIGVCTIMGGTLIADAEADTLFDFGNSVTYTFNFDNILPDSYENPHFTASGSQIDFPEDFIG